MTIRLRKVRSGNSLNVIVINGFLSEKNTDITDWLNVLDWDFQSTTVHHYDWDACNSKKNIKNCWNWKSRTAFFDKYNSHENNENCFSLSYRRYCGYKGGCRFL